jgi:hypothetical protein
MRHRRADAPTHATPPVPGVPGDEDAAHLLERGGAVRKKLQPLLTAHPVKTGIREGQRGRVSFLPFDRDAFPLRHRARNGEHIHIEIEPNHSACGPD